MGATAKRSVDACGRRWKRVVTVSRKCADVLLEPVVRLRAGDGGVDVPKGPTLWRRRELCGCVGNGKMGAASRAGCGRAFAPIRLEQPSSLREMSL